MGEVVRLRNLGMEKMNETFRSHWDACSELLDHKDLDHWMVVANNFHMATEMMCRGGELEGLQPEEFREFIHNTIDMHFDNA